MTTRTRPVRPVTFEEGLAYLIDEQFEGIEFDVDLKLPGYEQPVLDALRAFELLDRALISTQYASSLAAIREGRCNALMAHWRLASGCLVEAVADAGGELYVWTVDDLATLRALEALGVTGVVTNDPRLFAQL